MRIRSIKPQFFLNEELVRADKWGGKLRLLFIGLWCASDGHGRLQDRPSRLQVEILPYEEVPIDEMLDTLMEHDFIRRYAVDGKRLIQVTTFPIHQRISGKEAAMESQYPAPPNGWKPPERKTGSRAPRTRGQRAYEEDQEKHGRTHADINAGGDQGTTPRRGMPVVAMLDTQHAEEIYQAYPKKVGKPDAHRAIKKALQKVGVDELLEKTRSYASAVSACDPKFIPHPATWFNQERYNDDPTTWGLSGRPAQNASGHNPNAQMPAVESDQYAAAGLAIGSLPIYPDGDNPPVPEMPAQENPSEPPADL